MNATNSYSVREQELEECKRALIREIKQLRAQLAEHIKAANEVTDENMELETQLEVAQAAIKKAKETIRAWHGDEAWEIYDKHSPEMKIINAVGTAALDAVIAAATKSLVDTLRILRRGASLRQLVVIDIALDNLVP